MRVECAHGDGKTERSRETRRDMGIPQASLAKGTSHPIYQRLTQLLEESHFDAFVEEGCR